MSLHKLQHELLGNYSSPCVDGDFHAADLLVDVFHELDNEIDQLMLPQLLQVRVSHKEADVESLSNHARSGRTSAFIRLISPKNIITSLC